MRTLIKGGTIVNADATTTAHVLVDGERVALIGESPGVGWSASSVCLEEIED